MAKVEGGERRIDVMEFLDIVHALSADPCEILNAIDAAYSATQDNKTP